MRRTLLAPLLALAVLGVARDACAEDTVEAATVEPAKVEPAKVSVRVRLERDGEIANVFVERRGAWDFECRTPCTVDAAPGARLRIDVLGGDDESLIAEVPADATGTHDIDVGHRGRGAFIGGLAAIGAGAVSLALGMAIIRSADEDDLFGSANRVVARIMLLLGAGSVAAGGYLILTRSTAPAIMPSPATRKQAHDDLAPPRSTWLAPTTVGWTVRF